MGEEAFFTLINPVYLTGPSYIVSGNGGAQGSSNINSTRISGFLIPEGASGGSLVSLSWEYSRLIQAMLLAMEQYIY